MAKAELEFGIQECSKCRYKIRCEECVYNEKDIAELLRQERKATAKEIWNIAYKIACNTRGEITEKAIKDRAKVKYGVEVE